MATSRLVVLRNEAQDYQNGERDHSEADSQVKVQILHERDGCSE